jgi:hypothetical protein
MNIYLAKVSKVLDKLKFIIEFEIEGLIEQALAYPIDTFDEPNEGDPIIIYELESIFGYNFMYKKQRLFDHTRMKLQDSIVDIFDDHIEIHAGVSKSQILLKNDGTILVKSDQSVTVDSPKTTIVNATAVAAIPNLSGNLNCITNCPILGISHGINKNIKQG